MENRRATAFLMTVAVILAAGCMNTGQEKYSSTGRRISHPETVEDVPVAETQVDSPALAEKNLHDMSMRLKWQLPLSGVTVDHAYVENGLLLLDTTPDSGGGTRLYAVNLHNGCARWLFNFVNPIDSRPTFNNSTVWVSATSTIFPIDANSGGSLWRTPVSFVPNSPIYTIAKRQYIGTLEGSVYALSGSDKYPDWSFGTGAPISAMPLVATSTLIAPSEDGTVYGYNFSEKSNKWQVRTGDMITADMVQDENNVYVGSEDYYLYCIAKSNGAVMWKFPVQGPVRHPVLMMNEKTVLVKGEQSALYALDKETGNEIWHLADGVKPVALGDWLYVLTESGTVKAVDAKTGEVAWEQTISPFEVIPTNLKNDAIVLCSKDGHIYLIQEKDGEELKPELKTDGPGLPLPKQPMVGEADEEKE